MSDGHQVSFEWALPGALSLAETGVAVAVVVDVLSFSTAVSVACDRDAAVYPFAWRDERAAAYAGQVGAALAGPRRAPGLSLSPASIRSAPELGALVLPSPNGSSISFALQGKRCVVVAGCLRNAAAVASYLAGHLGAHPADNPAEGEATGRPHRVAVIAAGERWPDDSLRPAAEDLWGAGAILHRLIEQRGPNGFTAEARSVAAAFAAVAGDLPTALRDCPSGRELRDRGFGSDVTIAGELDASDRIPVLRDGAFRSP